MYATPRLHGTHLVGGPEAARAKDDMDRLFEDLQAIQAKSQALRNAGDPYDPALVGEWNRAYRSFTKAYERWRRLAGRWTD